MSFATGSGVQLAIKYNGDAAVYGVQLTAESLQDENSTITSEALGEKIKYGSDVLAIANGQSGSLEIEITDSLASQKLLHAANGIIGQREAIKNGVVLGYRGAGAIGSVAFDNTTKELIFKVDGAIIETLDLTALSFSGITGLINNSTLLQTAGFSAAILCYHGSESVPANLSTLGQDLGILPNNTEIELKGTGGYRSGLFIEHIANSNARCSYPGNPQPFTIEKGFSGINTATKWENCRIASLDLTIDQKAMVKASVSIQGGSGEDIANISTITKPAALNSFISTMQSNQFFGGIARLALQAAYTQDNATEKLDTFQGISQGSIRTGNINISVNTTARYDNEVEANILQPIKKGISMDWLFVMETKNESTENTLGFAGLMIIYLARVKSETLPPVQATGPQVVEVQPTFKALDLPMGESVALFTQGGE